MRYFTLVFPLLVLLAFSSPNRASTRTSAVQDAVVIQKRTVVIVRSGKDVRDLPSERRKAKVSYPIIKSGISNAAVLAKVRSLLKLKNIFETSLEEYREDTWLSELDYRINYNKNFILDITFRQDGVGAYPDSQEKHLAINLRNGELIKAADVFKPEALAKLAMLVDSRLQAEMKETIEQVNQDKSIDADEKQRVPELYEGLKIEVKDLDDFVIRDKGITFLYDAGFPHMVQAYQPAGQYQFSYAELAPHLQREGAPRSLTR
jgi:hypothetical protein